MNHRPTLLVALLAASVSVPATALAGTLQHRDTTGSLSADDATALRSAAQTYPFDARVVLGSEWASRESFDRAVGQLVAAPDMVVVGVDPVHHRTSVHFGVGTHIARARWRAIEDAGDGWFRQGQWRSGVEAILAAANASVGTAPDGVAPTGRAEAPSFPWGLVLFGAAGVGLVALMLRRRRAMDAGWGASDPYRGQAAMGYGPGAGPGYGPNYGPGYGPGYGPSQGSGLGAGLVGAGLGGLAGYAIGSAVSEHEHSRGGDQGYGGGNGGDAGGGWDSGGSSSYDAGGSTSGWDSGGGGGDFGGGGGDSGGGGGGGDW